MIIFKDLQSQLKEALAEWAFLREENERLKRLLGLPAEDIAKREKQKKKKGQISDVDSLNSMWFMSDRSFLSFTSLSRNRFRS